jgi:hypothetical protein
MKRTKRPTRAQKKKMNPNGSGNSKYAQKRAKEREARMKALQNEPTASGRRSEPVKTDSAAILKTIQTKGGLKSDPQVEADHRAEYFKEHGYYPEDHLEEDDEHGPVPDMMEALEESEAKGIVMGEDGTPDHFPMGDHEDPNGESDHPDSDADFGHDGMMHPNEARRFDPDPEETYYDNYRTNMESQAHEEEGW